MTGIGTEVDVNRLSFVPIEGVPMQPADEARQGIVLEFTGTPSGDIAILFDPAMRKGAIQEIGNIVTSGFLDGWADTLGTTVDIPPPTYVNDLGSAIVDPLVTEVAQTQEHAFLIDSAIATPDETFTCDIYAFPADNTDHSTKVYTTDPPTPARIKVGVAGYAATDGAGTLVANGLGSCVGIALVDTDAGAMTLLNQGPNRQSFDVDDCPGSATHE